MNVSCPAQPSMCLRKADECYSILSIKCIKHWWFFIDMLFLLLEHHERFTLMVLAVCLQKSGPLASKSGLQQVKTVMQSFATCFANSGNFRRNCIAVPALEKYIQCCI